MDKEYEATIVVREMNHVAPTVVGVLCASVVGVGALLAFGHHERPAVVHPVSAVTPAETPSPATRPGCVMLCDEPPLPPQQDTRGCRLFCELGMAPATGGGERS
ncbi:hypothetical protein ACWDSJ_37540 [Nocardia sp. NPDC003482]